ncbi:MAG: hypothetical protein AB1651_06925 [Pseudomonadota bacterium]
MAAALRWGWLAPIAALGLLSLWLRPLLPADETRYAAIAWEMWRDGQWLVPQLNGTPYSHKPPLLFWLMHAGWWLFGVNDGWPRLLGVLAAMLSGALTRALALRLFAAAPHIADSAPWLLVGTLYWLGDSTMLMFDQLLAACVLLAWLGVLRWRDGARGGLALAALGLGLGLLAKGPLAPLYVLPAFVFARPPQLSARRAAAQALLATAAAGALAALWLLPALHTGGAAYARALLHDQGVGRLVDAFAHALPGWWYLAILPLLGLPWSLAPRCWRALGAALRAGWRGAPGPRFCTGVAASTLVALSLVSGKQPHYLLPMFPLLALLLAHGAVEVLDARRTATLALATAALLALLFVAVAPRVFARFDLRAVSRVVAAEQARREVAFAGVYRGQFTFAGRLRRPLPTLSRAQVRAWLRQHPQALVIGEIDAADGSEAHAAVAIWPYRSRHFAAWTAASLARVPEALPGDAAQTVNQGDR